MARVASLIALVCLAGVVAASARPAMPSGYSVLFNVTAYSQGAPNGDNFLLDYYYGHNSTLTVVYAPTAFPYQLQTGAEQMNVNYNPATRACAVACDGGKTCSSHLPCGVSTGGIFGGLPFAKANGSCTYVPSATEYSVAIPQPDGATIALQYCFQKSKPVYVIETVTTPSGEISPELASRRLSNSVMPGSTAEVLIFLVGTFTPITPNTVTFNVPPFCKCST